MARFVALVLFSLLVGGEAAARDTEMRKTEGECAYSNSQTTFTQGKITSIGNFVEADVVSAELIAIEYFTNYKVVTESRSKELYVLTQCGATPPSLADLADVVSRHVNYTVKHFTIPLQVVSSESTVQLAFFKALGLEDRVKYVPGSAVDPCWQKALGCGATLDKSNASQMSEVDAIFMDCAWPNDCTVVNDVPKGVHISASQDPAPLHSAEHIKFVAAFFNKEELASQLFSTTLAAYASASVVSSTKPVVAWIQFYKESFILSQASYKLKMVADAGGANVNGQAVKTQMGSNMSKTEAATGNTYTTGLSSFNGSLASASAAFFAALDGVDVIIDETYAGWGVSPISYTFDTFMTTMGLTKESNLKFMVNRKVLRVDGTITDGDALDWYESRIARPEWAVEGLARQIHSNTSMPYRFFRNIADGEAPQVLSASSCTATPSACLLSAYPKLINMMNGTTGTGAAAIYTGSMTLQLADASAFVTSPNATIIMEHSIAAANDDISQDMVDVTNVALARRLSVKPRDLAAGGVQVDYTVTYAAGHSSPPLTKSSFSTTALITAIQTKAQESGLTVTVTSVVVADPTSSATTTTGAATTATTGSNAATTGDVANDAASSLARCLPLLLSFVFAVVQI